MAEIRVLYAEDELFLGKIIKESLETRGFSVVMESNGLNVLSAFNENKPDICVLDVMLPGKDGFTIAEEIRKIDEFVPIIFLTAKTQTNDVLKGFSSGGNDYIRKPFSMEELIVRIQNALRSKKENSFPDSNAVRFGKYQFHFTRQTLITNGEERKLSFRETELLKLLYENRDKIIDRKDILNLLWGNDSFFNSRNLDVYVTRLRSYLKEDPSIQLMTIKGIGYRFIVS